MDQPNYFTPCACARGKNIEQHYGYQYHQEHIIYIYIERGSPAVSLAFSAVYCVAGKLVKFGGLPRISMSKKYWRI